MACLCFVFEILAFAKLKEFAASIEGSAA